MALTSNDLELIYDGNIQKVGIRFPAVTIPQGSSITAAWIQFKAKEIQSEATSLLIQAQAIGNAPAFASVKFNVSSRARTVASLAWSPVPWTVLNEVGPNEKTPDLSAVIQEVVSQSTWASGNALAIIVTGTGHRTARSVDGDAAGAPLLHVEYH